MENQQIYLIQDQNIKYIYIIGGLLFIGNIIGFVLFWVLIKRSIETNLYLSYIKLINQLLVDIDKLKKENNSMKENKYISNSIGVNNVEPLGQLSEPLGIEVIKD